MSFRFISVLNGVVLSFLFLSCKHASECCSSKEKPSPAVVDNPPYSESKSQNSSLPTELRLLIHERMQGHGAQMSSLLRAVVFLEVENVQEIAAAIIAEPRFVGGEVEIPVQYLELEKKLLNQSIELKNLASKAEQGMNKKISDKTSAEFSQQLVVDIARQFGKMTETCTQCHAQYLYADVPWIQEAFKE